MKESSNVPTAIRKLQGNADFFAAIRFLQVLSNRRIGDDTTVAQEPIRLAAKSAIGFPATEVAEFASSSDGKAKASVTFMGLHGPSGALPQHYTQTIIDRVRQKDLTFENFLDLFNHRWLSLFYRGWEKNFLPAAFETAQASHEEDAITRVLWCLVGFGTEGIRGQVAFRESLLLHYSGHLSSARPTASSLQAVIADAFSVTVEIKQFQGQWMQLAESDQTRFGAAPLGMALNNRLGVDTVAGSRMWNVESRFRVVIGPLRYAKFRAFSPIGEQLPKLLEFIRTFVGAHLDFDVQVILDRRDVPGIKLGDQSSPALLGWNTWLGQWTAPHHPDQAIFSESI